MDFLPVSVEDLKKRNITELDFIIVSGDAYVDHQSFGVAIIGRILEKEGYNVGIIPQPDWRDINNFKTLGKPRLGFLVSAGNIDSMVNHYTVSKKLRTKDSYSPAGKIGLRPDRATIVYSNKIKEAYKDVPIIIGGIEASLRRLGHYDYWDNKVRRSILLDSAADLLVYGMAENQIVEVADSLNSGLSIEEITFIKGTVYKTKNIENVYDYIKLPSYKEICINKAKYIESFMAQYENTDAITAKNLIEDYSGVYVVQNAPTEPLSRSKLDSVYSLNYVGDYHSMYESLGGVPAIEEVKFSIISNRGCFGNCNFCALAFHQGRVIQSRSHESIINEAKNMVWRPDFKGYIHDVGGPTANFRNIACKKQATKGACKKRQCLFPTPCKHLNIDHTDYLKLLRKLRNIEGIKKVFIRSGIRYDYLIHDKNDEFINELCKYHVSGQLKVAPEHVAKEVLMKMGKPENNVYQKFIKKYENINKKLGMKQFVVPYLMSSHPGSTLSSAIELAEYLRDLKHTPEQVQDFYPTPGTLSTCMYYTEIDPLTMEKIYVPKSPKDKAMQRALIQYRLPQNYNLVREALKKAGREDLMGNHKEALIGYRPFKEKVKIANNQNKLKVKEPKIKGSKTREFKSKGFKPKK